LNGSKIPPLVPKVIDVRITHYEVTATIELRHHGQLMGINTA
jgi:hypothetical protein